MTTLNAVKNGATFKPADVEPGQLYWKLIMADGPEYWDGKHSIYVDVWGENGQRQVGVPVTFVWAGGSQTKPTEPKQGEPFAVDYPMFNARPAFSAWVNDGKPSDALQGMGLVPFEKHVVWKLIFQLTRAEGDVVVPPPPTTPGKRPKVRLYLDDVLVYEA